MRIKKNKKGLMLFHWILIFLVGVIIIFFAIVFATKTGLVEQYKHNVIVTEYLDLFFNPYASIGASTESFGKEVDLPYGVHLDFACKSSAAVKEERLRVGKGEIAEKKIHNIVYADFLEDKETKKLYVFSKPFEMPFRIADLIYAFDGDQKYCLRFDTSSSDIVNKIGVEIRDIFGGSIIPNNLGSKNNMNIGNCPLGAREIYFYNAGAFAEGDIRIVDESGGNFDYGTVIFYEKLNPSSPTIERPEKFIGFPMIMAAMFSDYEVYDCNFDRLMKKIQDIATLYQEKAEAIKFLPQGCGYDPLKNKLEEIKIAAGSFDLNSMQALYNAANEFAEENKNFNCAQVY